MPVRNAYPSVRKAQFRPKIRRKRKGKFKRKFVKNLNKFAETKEHADLAPAPFILANQGQSYFPPTNQGRQVRRDAMNVFIPGAFTYLPDDLIEGQSIYAKYLQMKLRITFPSGANILVPNQTLYLIHGYIDPLKLSMLETELDMTNGKKAISPSSTLIDKSYIPWKVMDLIYDEFNADNDQMAWLPKRKRRGYSILGFNKVKVDKDTSITSRTHLGAVTPGVGVQEGGPPQILRRITWPMNRKIQYTYSKPSDLLDGFYYPNDNAIPFVCLFNPQFMKQGFDDRPDAGQGVIQAETSSKLWYHDL